MKRVAANVLCKLPLVFIFLLVLFLLFFPDVTVSGAHHGLMICKSTIIPKMFPYFVVTNLWCSLGYAQKLSHITAPIMRTAFHLPGSAASALTLGLIGGYPAGAQALVRQYKQGELSKDAAEHLLLFCNNAGPAFILGVVGSTIFNDVKIGFALYLIHIVSAVIIGVIYRRSDDENDHANQEVEKRISFSSAFTDAVRQAGYTAFQVSVFVIFFAVLLSYFSAFLPESLSKSALCKFLLAALELASGVILLQDCRNKAILFCQISYLLAFGGFCVYFQTISILDETDLSKSRYFISKLLHGSISILLSVPVAAFLLFPGQIAMSNRLFHNTKPILYAIPFIILSLLVLFLKNTSGKSGSNQV